MKKIFFILTFLLFPSFVFAVANTPQNLLPDTSFCPAYAYTVYDNQYHYFDEKCQCYSCVRTTSGTYDTALIQFDNNTIDVYDSSNVEISSRTDFFTYTIDSSYPWNSFEQDNFYSYNGKVIKEAYNVTPLSWMGSTVEASEPIDLTPISNSLTAIDSNISNLNSSITSIYDISYLVIVIFLGSLIVFAILYYFFKII